MKYSIALASTFSALVLAKPSLLNSDFNVQENVPFTLKYSGCSSGCTIILQNGPKNDRQDFQILTDNAKGSSATVTVPTVPSDTYNFKIVDNSDGSENYSEPFDISGTTATSTTAASTTSAESTSTESSTSSTKKTTKTTKTTETKTTKTKKTTLSTVTTSDASSTSSEASTTSSEASTTTEASSTTSSEPSTTSSAPTSTTTVPDDDGAAGHLKSPLGLAAGVFAAALYLI